MQTSDVSNALTAKCEKDGYTGCHLWKVTVANNSTLSTATLKLQLTVDAEKQEDWSYVLFKGTGSEEGEKGDDATATEIIKSGSFSTVGSMSDVKTETSLEAGSHVYYLMVYLKNQEKQQDSSDDNATGTYTGSFTLQAASGTQIMASFTA